MEEVIERARKAIVELEELKRGHIESNMEDVRRIAGKIEGIKLVIGYYEE